MNMPPFSRERSSYGLRGVTCAAFRPGDAYHNARDVIHETRNVGDVPARLAIVFVIEKGKPITEPVP